MDVYVCYSVMLTRITYRYLYGPTITINFYGIVYTNTAKCRRNCIIHNYYFLMLVSLSILDGCVCTVGFLKLDNSELKPVLVSSAPPPATATNGSATLNHTENKSGSFTSFIQSARSVRIENITCRCTVFRCYCGLKKYCKCVNVHMYIK